MDKHQVLQGSGGALDSCRAAQEEDEDAVLSVSVPPGLRAIFQVWSQDCDPAPMLPRGGDMRALVAAYVRLGAAAGATPVERALLVRVYVNAALNCEFALWTELRHEAATVLRWLAPIVAADPALRAQVALAWPCPP
ncbi:hypothetical protein INH39_04410 [Massilia violaceinigra]|uniref:Uncharacterized protein n=1 Tax=Massilia violaceinigra TaxID=2045208 RepID=A0ABY4AEJ3_9BURK|nr:hypothetical protein [Massilia violaceinigra]UOD30983.1 hypothetical protein INH39_04410 [Massilia violaceinigra]